MKKKFNKYAYYTRAVQSPETDALFFQKTFQRLKGRPAKVFREDFCGTFALSAEWVKLNARNIAIGVDFDPEPLAYGGQRKSPDPRRLHLVQQNVLEGKLPAAELVVAINFSYFIFQKREILRQYFANVQKSLKPGGLFFIDAFGGSACQEPNEEETKLRDFTYYWEQASFDPISSRAVFYIHFKLKGERKRERVFKYDWRMWSLPELREIMMEAGFKKTHVYWEGSTKSGKGNGIFTRREKGEACQGWIAYVVAEK